MSEENSYPALRFMLRYGNALAWVLGLAILAGGFWGTYLSGNWWCAAGGVIGAPLFFLLFRSYYEVLQIVADTLLPPP